MRLENILALTQGNLLGEPSVSIFENVVFDPSKVKRGSLFIAYSSDDIPEALLNGAYGVMFDRPTQITDSEIAWIKVDNLDTALKKLLRFYLLEKELQVYACDPITLHLSTMITTPPTFCNVEGTMREVWEKLWPLEKKSIVLFSPTLTDPDIFIEHSQLIRAQENTITIIEQTLFETSFIHNDTFYERQMLSPFFIPYLEHLLFFYTFLRVPFQIRGFSKMGHFIPVFTNARMEIKEFGSSERVVIFEPLLELIDEQIDFLDAQASWAKIICLLPESMRSALTIGVENILFYRYPEEIIALLQSKDFHFALVAGVDKSILRPSRSSMKQLELDFF
jgi:ferrochelatase